MLTFVPANVPLCGVGPVFPPLASTATSLGANFSESLIKVFINHSAD